MSLGQATFTVTANTSAFTQGMQQAQAQAQQTTNAISASFNGLLIVPRQLAAINQTLMATNNALAALSQRAANASSSVKGIGGGFGSPLFALSQAVDDIQYGFQAIVNNVGQIGMGLGSAIGLAPPQAQAFAAALQIAAVAANQLYKHWDDMFGSGSKLPTIKDGLEGLAESLGKIKEQLDPLRKVADDIAEGNRGTFGQMADMMGFGEGSLKNRMKLEQLKEMEKTVKERLKDERLLEATGAEHTEQAQKTGAAVRKAVSKLPQGSESLVATLMARGMTLEEARKAVAGAMRGNAGHLDDIVGKLTPAERMGKFAGLTAATLPQQRNAEQMRKIEGSMEEFEGDAKKRRDEHNRRGALLMRDNEAQMEQEARANEKMRRDKKRAREEEAREARHGRHVRRQVRDILDASGPGAGGREGGFVGFAEMSKQIQAGALDQQKDIQMRQLKALQRIVDLMEDNPEMAAEIRKMAGMPAVAGGPN